MSGYYTHSPYHKNSSLNLSLDPFSSPQSERRDNFNRQSQQPQQSIDIFAETPKLKRRSYTENGSISRAIGNALDPDYGYSESALSTFDPSTSDNTDYDDDASILAAVSSAHSSQGSLSNLSSQERSLSQHSVSSLFRKTGRKEKSKHESNDEYSSMSKNETGGGYAAIFNKPSKQNDEEREDPMMLDFLSPDQMARYRKLRKPRAKQIRMDDYVFKARRVDKGAREFGLHTTHEPKRGSKKKRDSIEQLEVEKIEFEKQKHKKEKIVIEQRKNEVENLDFSLAFGTPSPVRSRTKTSKLTQFFEKDVSKSTTPSKKKSNASHYSHIYRNSKSIITSNDPSIYSNDSVLEATLCSTPEKSVLQETIPLNIPSSIRNKLTPQRNMTMERFCERPALVKPNSFKRKELSFESPDRQPLAQPKRKKTFSDKRKPEFYDRTGRVSLSDDEDQKVKMEQSKRPTLQKEEDKRKQFSAHVTEREQLMKQLVDQKFKEERENGGIERRRAELKDGQVIRNKEMRKNLMHGAACKCCRGYYDGLGMEEHEKKDYIDKVSRHRYVHQAFPDTPAHYWDLTMGPRDTQTNQQNQSTVQRSWETSIKNKKSEEQSGIHNWI